MQTFTKAMVGTAIAGAMALTSAAPAAAQYRDRGIDAGDVIAGAVILGGIVAVASAVGNNRNDRYDDRYQTRGYGYDDDDDDYDDRNRRGYNRGQRAVQLCAAAVERDVRRYGYRYSDVTQIRDVDRERYGFQVKGRLIVDGQRRGYDNRYDRRGARADQGKFTCDVSRGRVVGIDYSGIRGLR